MASKKTNEIATVNKNEVALPFDYGVDAGVGLDLTLDDLKIPFITLAQGDSKILDEDEENYVPGGAPGMLFNAATKQYSDRLLLVPAVKRVTYVEWLPDRGGFAGEHLPSDPVVRQAKANAVSRNELRNPENGNQLQETRSIFCIVIDEANEPVGFCVVPFASSKIGPWREYFTALDTAKVTRNAPLFAHTIALSSVNAVGKGKKYKNYQMIPARDADGNIATDPLKANVISSMIPPDSAAYQAAVQLRDAITEGRAEADRDTAEDATGATSDGHF